MSDAGRLVTICLVVAIVALGALRSGGKHVAGALGGGVHRDAAGLRVIDAPARAATLTFAPDVSAADRQAVLDAVAGARPAARRLVGVIDGLVDVEVGRPSAGAAGQTIVGGARYPMVLDVDGVRARYGARGVARLTLHELGHVVDDALVPDRVMAELDAATPQGYGCLEGVGGGCATRPERFAESFAKWATNDIGMNIDLGYQVPPPSLATWGVPLESLGRAPA